MSVIENNVKASIADVCHVKCDITSDMVLRDHPINCDSLDLVQIALQLEYELTIQIDVGYLDKCKTVAEVIDYVDSIVKEE